MKVSIITPTKNSAKYIETCIKSVLNQADHEHIFIDGGSTDNTLAILKSYDQYYPDSIKYIQGKDNSAGEAWVNGLRMATGDIFGWLGSDDTLEPNAIKTVTEFFTDNPFADFMFGGCNRIDESGKVISRIKTKEFNIWDAINNYCSIPCTSAFYRRKVIEQVNPDIIAKNDGELEYWLMVGKRFKIWRIEQVLSNFRIYQDKARKDGFYQNAKTVYRINRRHGAEWFSPCARRYYLSLVTYPLSPMIDPLFRKITQGRNK